MDYGEQRDEDRIYHSTKGKRYILLNQQRTKSLTKCYINSIHLQPYKFNQLDQLNNIASIKLIADVDSGTDFYINDAKQYIDIRKYFIN